MGSQGSRCVAPPISERAGSEQMVLSAITAAPEIRWCVRVCLCVSGHETDSGGQRGHWGKFTSAWIIRAERMPEREHGGDTSSAEEARQEITKPSPNEKQTAVFFWCCFFVFLPGTAAGSLVISFRNLRFIPTGTVLTALTIPSLNSWRFMPTALQGALLWTTSSTL